MKKWMLLIFMIATFFFVGTVNAQATKIGCFAVTAYNNYGESGYSEIICTIDSVAVGATVTLAWNAVAEADGYKCYYRTDTTSDWQAPIDVGNQLTCPIPAAAIFAPICENVGLTVDVILANP